MKICLELHSETLAEFRAELETFLAPSATAAAAPTVNATVMVATRPGDRRARHRSGVHRYDRGSP